MVRQLIKRGFFGILLVLVFFLAVPVVSPQDFPKKPVALIIPFGPGGSHDLTGRALSSVAPDCLGVPLPIHLKGGGGGAIGSDFVASAIPDGYTLLFDRCLITNGTGSKRRYT